MFGNMLFFIPALMLMNQVDFNDPVNVRRLGTVGWIGLVEKKERLFLRFFCCCCSLSAGVGDWLRRRSSRLLSPP
jgi:hypothetical protein